MSKQTTPSRAKRILAAQQTHRDQHPVPDAIKVPTHDDIARRAYDLYVTSGHKQGRCELNWQQAEYDLHDHGIDDRTITAIRGMNPDAAGIATVGR